VTSGNGRDVLHGGPAVVLPVAVLVAVGLSYGPSPPVGGFHSSPPTWSATPRRITALTCW